jgi:hypothetical protein
MTKITIGSNPKHAYEVEVLKDGNVQYITVLANNRTQAAAAVEKTGLIVRSVNMTG